MAIRYIKTETGGIMKICVIGTHGIGKTTFLTNFYLFALHNGINTKVVREVARDCPLGINENFNPYSAAWILTEQINRELDAKAKNFPLVLCDRSAFDPMMYSIVKFGLEEVGFKEMYNFAVRWMDTYDVIIWLRPSGMAITNDGIRAVDDRFQRQIDETFYEHMNLYKSRNEAKPVIELNSSAVYKKDLEIFFRNQVGNLYVGDR